MPILADVNGTKAIVVALRAVGHDVLWAGDQMASEPDFEILAQAQRQSRIVLTNDKDFSDLAIQAGLPAACGVILLRWNGMTLDEVVARAVQAITSRRDWAGHLAVVDRMRIRMRRLPPPPSSAAGP